MATVIVDGKVHIIPDKNAKPIATNQIYLAQNGATGNAFYNGKVLNIPVSIYSQGTNNAFQVALKNGGCCNGSIFGTGLGVVYPTFGINNSTCCTNSCNNELSSTEKLLIIGTGDVQDYVEIWNDNFLHMI